MPELQIRLPYQAWGEGDEWQEGYEGLLHDFEVALEESDLGEADEPDHFDEFICFYLYGADETALARLAVDVLERHGFLQLATGFVSEDPDDFDKGRIVELSTR